MPVMLLGGVGHVWGNRSRREVSRRPTSRRTWSGSPKALDKVAAPWLKVSTVHRKVVRIAGRGQLLELLASATQQIRGRGEVPLQPGKSEGVLAPRQQGERSRAPRPRSCGSSSSHHYATTTVPPCDRRADERVPRGAAPAGVV